MSNHLFVCNLILLIIKKNSKMLFFLSFSKNSYFSKNKSHKSTQFFFNYKFVISQKKVLNFGILSTEKI